MARLLLDVFLWVVVSGFVTFCVLYMVLARPWNNHMGRHMLAFMSGFAISFIYAMISRYIDEQERIRGWVAVLILISALVWWRVFLLIYYQLKARRMDDKV